MARDGSQAMLRLAIACREPLLWPGIIGQATVAAMVVDVCCTNVDDLNDHLDDIDIIVAGPLDGGTPLDLLRAIRLARLPARLVVLADAADNWLWQGAIDGNVDGLLLRTAPANQLGRCLQTIAVGGRWIDAAVLALREINAAGPALTQRERDVARLVATGERNRGIATALGISEGTVKMHLHNVYSKLGLQTRTQLALDPRVPG